MAGQYPPPPRPRRRQASPYGRPGPGPPGYGPPGYGPPGHGPAQYRYAPPRRGPRRSAGGTIAGLIGALTSLVVVAIVGMTLLAGSDGLAGTRGPVSYGTARDAAVDSKLYETGELTPVNCRVPRIQRGAQSMRAFMNVLSDCLDESWTRQFGKAGLTFETPDRVFWDSPGRSPCGTYPAPGASAFYCPANNTMYIGVRHVVETSGNEPLSNYSVFARVVAHEYGHHVQERAGILLYGNRLMDTGDTGARNEASRRIELQAQCLAGAFLGTERETLPMPSRQVNAMIRDVRGRGDDRLPPEQRDHGSGRNYAGWVVTGFEERRLTVCNTWTVPSSDVD